MSKIHLITGLLASGKTTTLLHLKQQKPKHEHWALVINEFGSLDIDASSLSSQDIDVIEVKGGCLCCSAQAIMQQSMQRLLSSEHRYDRIWIEASGLGHPAQTQDLVRQLSHRFQAQIRANLCIISPKQLTEERWKKSTRMQNLITLADLILLNQCDLSSDQEIDTALKLLKQHKPDYDETKLWQQYHSIQLSEIDQEPNKRFTPILLDAPHDAIQTLTLDSELPVILSCQAQFNPKTSTILSIAWQFDPRVQFMRTQLKNAFIDFQASIVRLKGILKTGREWHKFDWHQNQAFFHEIAWRKDSRIVVLLEPVSEEDFKPIFCQLTEVILSCIHLPSLNQNVLKRID